jgi:acetolactate synthase-1/2/3 large subunit
VSSPPDAAPRSGAEILADLIAAWDLGPVFHVPGEGILDLLDALARRHPALPLVTARQEGGMAFMASGAARARGRASVCLAARAPGALNTCLALHTAMTDAVPLIMVIGQAALRHFERESFLDTDLHRVFAPLAKWVALVPAADRIPEMLSRAVHIAHTGRHGPVVLILPEDVAAETAEVADLPPPRVTLPAPSAADIAAVAERLAAASRPLILAGGGDWSVTDCARLHAVAGRLGLPVAVAYRRRDLFDNDDLRFAGEIGIGIDPALARRVQDADLILAIGIRLGELNTIGGGFHGFGLLDAPRPRQTLIHAHADVGELNRVFQADLALHAAPGPFLAALAAHYPRSNRAWVAWTAAARRDRKAWTAPRPCPGPVDLPAVLAGLRDTLPDDTIVTVGAGAYALWAQRYFPQRRPRTMFGPKSGAMGYGLPAAIGAAVACPERRVVALAGDGCFMMNGEELATAVQRRLPIVTIVFNNAAYGAIRLTQLRQFGRAVGTELATPDFAAYARSFGAHGERVTDTAGFAPAFARATAAEGPALIDLIVPAEATRPA